MQRIYSTNRVTVLPAAPAPSVSPGYFSANCAAPTNFSPEWANGIQEEIANAITFFGLTLDHSTLTQLQAAVRRGDGSNVRTVTSSTTLTAADAGIILINIAGAATITLPSISSAPWAMFHFIRIDSNGVTATISRAGGNTIDFGGTSFTLNGQGSKRTLRADGNNIWYSTEGGSITSAPIVAPGTVVYLAYNPVANPPTGYLRANGAAVSRTTYSDLFSVIGTAYGVGDGSTTFNLPDLRGEFIRSLDDGRGIDAARTIASFQNHAMQNHQHYVGGPNAGAGPAPRWGATGANDALASYVSTSTGPTGNFNANETRPRNLPLLAVIKF